MLPRANRITERREFDRFYSRGRQIRSPVLAVYALPRKEAEPRFGISVSKKVGGAVERNLVKRRLREACRRELRNGVLPADFVLVARPSALHTDFEPLCAATEDLIQRVADEVLRGVQRRAQDGKR